ncbi:lysozyme [Bacteroides sedimenti]|uniref:Lysozyme n=1 Tax=Bacteroides sedimenti TaxID=2136147 RepID=A0ABN6Z727_9BACE
MKTGELGIKLIKHYEGRHDGEPKTPGMQPIMCPAGIWTVGYGHALVNKKTGRFLKGKGDYEIVRAQYPQYINMTDKQAEILLASDLQKTEAKVSSRLKVKVSQNQFDALVSHTYNTGGSNQLFDAVNMQISPDKIANWIETHYITAEGKSLPGLVKRRKSEAALFSRNTLILL